MARYVVTGEPIGSRAQLPPYDLITDQMSVGQQVTLSLSAQDEATLIGAGILQPYPGAGVFRGAWAANRQYLQNDVVLSAGSLWEANLDFTSGTSFNAANWTQLSGSVIPMTLTQRVPGETTLTLDGRPDNHYNDVVLSIYSQRAGRGITVQDDCGIFTPGYVVAGNPTWPAINQVGFMIGGQSDVNSPTFLSEINRTANPGSTHFQCQDSAASNAPGLVIDGSLSPLLWWGAGTTGTLTDTSLGRTAAGKLSIGNSAAAVNGLGLAGGSTIYSGSGAPAAGLGANGDYYLRSDTPGTASQRIYVRSAGAWTGIL